MNILRNLYVYNFLKNRGLSYFMEIPFPYKETARGVDSIFSRTTNKNLTSLHTDFCLSVSF